MERKIQKLKGSFYISLPSTYIKKEGLNKGDKLSCLIWADRAIFSPKQEGKRHEIEEITFNLKGLTASTIWRTLSHLYTYGTKKVILYFDQKKIKDYIRFSTEMISVPDFLKKILPNYQGFEITQETQNKIIIEQTTPLKEIAFKDSFMKLYYQINLTFQNYITAVETKNLKMLQEIPWFDLDTINPQYKMCLRALNQVGYEDFRRSMVSYLGVSFYELLGDLIVELAEATLRNKGKISTKTIEAIKEIHRLYTKYFEPFKKITIQEITEFVKIRSEIENKIKRKTNDPDIELKTYAWTILLQMTHIIDTHVSKEWITTKKQYLG